MEGDIMPRPRRAVPRVRFAPLSPEQERRVLDNERLAFWLARRFGRRWPWLDVDDLKQEALVGLVKAARGFDPSRGAAFSTYCVRAVCRRLEHYAQREARERHASIQPGYSPDHGGEEGQHGRDVVDPRSARPQECREAAELARWLLSQVREPDGWLLRAYYLDGLSARQLAAALGISPTGVCDKLRRACRYARAFGESTGLSCVVGR
jgi:RNA polymerase sigma factor (sigma-70 family)